MSFLPSFLFRGHVHETTLKLRSFNHFICVWLRRPPGAPSPAEDYAEMSAWVLANRQSIDQREPEDVMAEMIRRFPRITKLEFMNGSLTQGVVVHV